MPTASSAPSVTVAVGALPEAAITSALAAGMREAEAMRARGLIFQAYLSLQGRATATEAAMVECA